MAGQLMLFVMLNNATEWLSCRLRVYLSITCW